MKAATRRQIVEVLSSKGHPKLSRQFRLATAGNLDDVLEELIDMAAESAEYDYDRGDIEVTPEVKREAAKFEKACEKALEEWVKKHPLKEGYDADDLMDEDGPYNVLMTLRGEGVGIWDGRWDHFFNDEKEIKELEKHLDRKLGKFADDTGGGSLNMAFDDAAYELVGQDDEGEASAAKPLPKGYKKGERDAMRRFQQASAKKEVIKTLIKAGKIKLANRYAGKKVKANWQNQAVADLADELGVEVDDLEWEEARYTSYNAIQVTNGREEYLVFEDSDDAEREAMERVQNDLEEDASMFNRDWLLGHVFVTDTDARLIGNDEGNARREDYEYEAQRENYDDLMRDANMEAKFDKLVDAIESVEEKISDLEDEVESGNDEMENLNDQLKGLDAKSPQFKKLTQQHAKIKKSVDKMEKDLIKFRKALPKMQETKEKMVEDAIDAVELEISESVQKEIKDDPIGWAEERGFDIGRDWPNWIRIDYESAAKDAVGTDGAAHFLASYDGNEIDLADGGVAYRTN